MHFRSNSKRTLPTALHPLSIPALSHTLPSRLFCRLPVLPALSLNPNLHAIHVVSPHLFARHHRHFPLKSSQAEPKPTFRASSTRPSPPTLPHATPPLSHFLLSWTLTGAPGCYPPPAATSADCERNQATDAASSQQPSDYNTPSPSTLGTLKLRTIHVRHAMHTVVLPTCVYLDSTACILAVRKQL